MSDRIGGRLPGHDGGRAPGRGQLRRGLDGWRRRPLILGEAASSPYPDGNDAHCLGHVADELGHVFGLEHTGPDEDCMQFGFYDAETMCRFSAANRAAVRNDPANVGWLDVELDLPLDPDPAERVDESVADPGTVEVTFENVGCRPVNVHRIDAGGCGS